MKLSLFMLVFLYCNVTLGNSFYEQRYRGWLWFEGKKEEEEDSSKGNYKDSVVTPDEAKAEIEQFAKELEKRKYVMLARPTPENVKKYRDKEKEMWDKAIELNESWDMANFLYPQQQDLINNPVNVHAVKSKRQHDAKEQDKKVREFAKKYELVFFLKNNCHYCHEFAPVFENFSREFGFNSEQVILDDFKINHKGAYIAKKLNINATPTVYVVSKDGLSAFELVRGFVSRSELKTAVVMALKYVNNKSQSKEIRIN